MFDGGVGLGHLFGTEALALEFQCLPAARNESDQRRALRLRWLDFSGPRRARRIGPTSRSGARFERRVLGGLRLQSSQCRLCRRHHGAGRR